MANKKNKKEPEMEDLEDIEDEDVEDMEDGEDLEEPKPVPPRQTKKLPVAEEPTSLEDEIARLRNELEIRETEANKNKFFETAHVRVEILERDLSALKEEISRLYKNQKALNENFKTLVERKK